MLAGLLRGLIAVATSAAALLLLIGALVLIQGQRDETRPAGAAIVLGAEAWTGDGAAMRQARLDHALDLYRSGVVSRIIVTGSASDGAGPSEAAQSRDYLVERGVPQEGLALEEGGVTTLECLRSAVTLARGGGVESVLLVSDPPHMLRSLKMARDMQLTAYGSPTLNSPAMRSFTAQLGYAARESWAYVVYVFARR